MSDFLHNQYYRVLQPKLDEIRTMFRTVDTLHNAIPDDSEDAVEFLLNLADNCGIIANELKGVMHTARLTAQLHKDRGTL